MHASPREQVHKRQSSIEIYDEILRCLRIPSTNIVNRLRRPFVAMLCSAFSVPSIFREKHKHFYYTERCFNSSPRIDCCKLKNQRGETSIFLVSASANVGRDSQASREVFLKKPAPKQLLIIHFTPQNFNLQLDLVQPGLSLRSKLIFSLLQSTFSAQCAQRLGFKWRKHPLLVINDSDWEGAMINKINLSMNRTLNSWLISRKTPTRQSTAMIRTKIQIFPTWCKTEKCFSFVWHVR